MELVQRQVGDERKVFLYTKPTRRRVAIDTPSRARVLEPPEQKLYFSSRSLLFPDRSTARDVKPWKYMVSEIESA